MSEGFPQNRGNENRTKDTVPELATVAEGLAEKLKVQKESEEVVEDFHLEPRELNPEQEQELRDVLQRIDTTN